MAFNAAAFSTYIICSLYAGEPWAVPAVAGGWTLAAATAALRIAGGSHYTTDVLAGALIGSLTGVLIPFFHMNRIEAELPGDAELRIAPSAGGLTVRLSM